MTDNKHGFRDRFEQAVTLAQKGNTAYTAAVNIKTVANGICKRLTELHAKSCSSQQIPFAALAQSLPSSTSQSARRNQILTELTNTQCNIALQARQKKSVDYSAIANSASVSNFASSVLSGAMVLNAACTLIDGYFTRRTLREGFDRLDTTLQNGFDNLSKTIENGFEKLDSRFSWGFSELMWRAEQQTEATQVTNKLLIEWLDVRAQELRKKGIECYNFGWFDQALEFFLEAMGKAKIDYVVAQYLGNIYLFHKQDTERAIIYYNQAATFSEPHSSAHRIIALMHQALAYYLANNEDKQKDWTAASNCVKKALDIEPSNLELAYTFAQYSALSGNSSAAIQTLNKLIRADVKYIVKILSEPDFTVIHDQISGLLSDYENELSLSFLTLLQSISKKIVPALDWWESTLLYGIEYAPPSGKFDIQNRSALTVSAPPGWQVVGRKIRTIDPSSADKLQVIIEAIEQICDIYKRGDILSIIKAWDLLSHIEIPSIECRNETITFSKLGYAWDGKIEHKGDVGSVGFTYYGIGDINI